MGEWFNYSMKFANKQGKLSDKLVEMGIAERQPKVLSDRRNVTEYRIFLDRFENYIGEEARNIFSHEFSLDPPLTSFVIGEEGDENIYYANKWAPDDRLAIAIGKAVGVDRENIVEITCDYTGGFHYIKWYGKDGQCTKDGSHVYGTITRISSNLLKDIGNEYQVRLPIGDENARWGSFTLPKENVTYKTCTYEDAETHEVKTEMYGVTVFFDKEKIPVSFRGRVVEMDVSDIEDKFYQSKEDYRNDITKPVILEVPAENVTKRTNNYSEYFIVKIPCTILYSSNEEMSIAVSIGNVRDAGNGNYVVDIGEKGKSHKVYYKNEERTKTIGLKNSEIANIFREGIAEHPERYNEIVRNQSHVEDDVYRTLPYVDEEMQANYGNQRSEEQEEVVFDGNELPFN